jgi:hypothetical protein
MGGQQPQYNQISVRHPRNKETSGNGSNKLPGPLRESRRTKATQNVKCSKSDIQPFQTI